MPSKANVSLLIFCLNDLSIGVFQDEKMTPANAVGCIIGKEL